MDVYFLDVSIMFLCTKYSGWILERVYAVLSVQASFFLGARGAWEFADLL